MLAARIAHVRTWNYVACRRDWVADAAALRARARAIEDRLSDALHERLTQRFVDRRAARLARRLKERPALAAEIDAAGAATVEGEPVGRLEGFRFVPDDAEGWRVSHALRAAARRVLDPAIRERARRVAAAPDDAFALAADGAVTWSGAPVARLARGAGPLRPALRLVAAERLSERARAGVERRLAAWLEGHIARALAPLFEARRAAPRRPCRRPSVPDRRSRRRRRARGRPPARPCAPRPQGPRRDGGSPRQRNGLHAGDARTGAPAPARAVVVRP